MSYRDRFIELNTPVDYYDEDEYLYQCEVQANCYGDYDEPDEED